jgi:histidinol-phosphate aminotransferase
VPIQPLANIKLLPQSAFANIDIPAEQIRIEISANESALGPSPLAIEAFNHAVSKLSRYPSPTADGLRHKLAQTHGLTAAQYVCSTGSENLIHLVVTAFAGIGDEVIMGERAFLVGKMATVVHGAKPIIVPDLPDLSHDLDAMLSAITDKTRIVYLPNPNNPTGNCFSKQAIQDFHQALPDHIVLILDTAYGEYITDESYSRGFELVEDGAENVIVLGTFSKIFGLASLRVGWGYGHPELMDFTNRVKGAFTVAGPAQEAAIKALEDTPHMLKERNHVNQQRPLLVEQLRTVGINTGEHCGNFIAARFPGGETQAKQAFQFLLQHGTVVKALGSYNLADALRISIGTEQEMQAVIQQLTAFMQGGSS